MSDHIYWILAVKINEGEQDNFKNLMNEMIETVQRDEPGALNYEWSIGEDGRTCHIYERYADCDATMAHMSSFGKMYAKKFVSLSRVMGITVYGTPDETVKGALSAMGPVYLSPIGGFNRF